jgi:hypothetical protein
MCRALLVRSGRRLVLKLQRDYPLLDRFLAALARLELLPPAGRLTPFTSAEEPPENAGLVRASPTTCICRH